MARALVNILNEDLRYLSGGASQNDHRYRQMVRLNKEFVTLGYKARHRRHASQPFPPHDERIKYGKAIVKESVSVLR